jgi:hypothetical protein
MKKGVAEGAEFVGEWSLCESDILLLIEGLDELIKDDAETVAISGILDLVGEFPKEHNLPELIAAVEGRKAQAEHIQKALRGMLQEGHKANGEDEKTNGHDPNLAGSDVSPVDCTG